jgi:hypothetical protein
MQSRPQIDENVRKHLLDNYLRNQQIQSNSSTGNSIPSFHPSQFQNSIDDRSETFSDISRRSSRMNGQQMSSSLVQVTEHTSIPSQPNQTNMTSNTSIVPINELPDNISIEDFSNLVKKWIEIDNWIKKSQEAARQKKKQKDKLTEVITHYMSRYNIEDLNTSEGKIRCKVRHVKSGVNQKVVKEKINEFLKDNEETCNALISRIFVEREKVEKISLRRIKIT